MKTKHFVLVMTMVLMSVATAFSQAPLSFTYQAVVRNSNGRLISNSTVGVKISILQGSSTGTAVYTNNYTPRTNANGLFSIVVGDSLNSIGAIDWAAGPYFLKSEVDPNGGNNYTIVSSQQMLSVPYALHAHTVDNVIGGVNFIERQVLSISNDTVFLTGGSFVKLPAGFSGNYNDLTNKPTIPTVPTNVSAFTNDAGYLTSFTETQVLSIRHDTVFLTGGSFVKLPAGFSGNYNDLTNKPTIPTVPTNVSAFTNDAGYLTSFTETQKLSDVAANNDSVNSQIKNLTDPTDSMDAVNLRTLNAVVSRYDSIIVNLVRVVDTLRNNINNNVINDFSFSVSEISRVIFSPGNLQWSATGGGSTATTHTVAGGGTAAGTCRFAPNQWDTIGASNSNISSSYPGWIDLFGWGTSGYHKTSDANNTNYFPYSSNITTVNTNLNYYGYGPSLNNEDIHLYGTSAFYDWGLYNTIYNPKTDTTYSAGTWRTLTNSEFYYLVNGRSTSSGILFAKAIVNGVPGLIIVPDNWSDTIYTLNSTNIINAAYTSNVISYSNWSVLENKGVVFLPAAGRRSNRTFGGDGTGNYWLSTTPDTGSNTSGAGGHNLYFSDRKNPAANTFNTSSGRSYGFSVRLVRDVR